MDSIKNDELAKKIEEIKKELLAEITEYVEKSVVIGTSISSADTLKSVTNLAEKMIEESLPDGYKVKMINPHYDDRYIIFDGFTILRGEQDVAKFKRSSMKEDENGD